MSKNKNKFKQDVNADMLDTEEINTELDNEEVVEEVIEKKEVEKAIPATKTNVSLESKISSILKSDLDFKSRLEAYKNINDEFNSIISVIIAFDNEYQRLRTNNMYLSEKDITFTVNLFNAIKYLLSPTEFLDLKVNLEVLIDIVKNLRTTSLHPLSYASGLDKWPGRQEDAEELLCVMHALNTLVIEGPVKTLRLINFSKFKHGQKIKDYLTRF